MPSEEDNKHYFEVNDEKICRLYRVEEDPVVAVKTLYEAMKDFAPEVVLTIGDYYETDYVHAVKSAYPQLFKWVAVITPSSLPIESGHKNSLDYIDECLVTTRDGYKAISSMISSPCIYTNPGIDLNVFKPSSKEYDEFRIMANLKNSHSSNLPTFLKALSMLRGQSYPFKAYLHTNLNDKGDYNVPLLISDYDLEGCVELPHQFSSIQEGIADVQLRDCLNAAHLYVDTSMQSSTAMGMLESMACECVPLGVKVGAMADVISQMPERWQHIIDSVSFVGERHQEMQVADFKSVAELIRLQYLEFKANGLATKRAVSKQIAQRYSQEHFVLEVESAIGRSVGEKQPVLAVEELATRKRRNRQTA